MPVSLLSLQLLCMQHRPCHTDLRVGQGAVENVTDDFWWHSDLGVCTGPLPSTVCREALLLQVSIFWACSDTGHCSGLLTGQIHPGKREQHVRPRVSPTSWVGNCVLIEQASLDDVGLISLLKHMMKDCSLKT